jgi:hypothetical protein
MIIYILIMKYRISIIILVDIAPYLTTKDNYSNLWLFLLWQISIPKSY